MGGSDKKNRPPLIVLAVIFLWLLSPGGLAAAAIAEREVLPSGMVLLHSEKKALPLVTVVVAIKAGSIVEPASKAGLANLTADLLNEGTSSRTSQEISEAIEFVGGSLSAAAGAEYVTVRLTVLKKDLELGFDLLSDIIRRPSFNGEEVTRRKAIIKSTIIQQNDEPGTVAAKAFAKAVFGEHPYGRPVEGTVESLDSVTREDIAAFHKTWYSPNNSIMAVVGDIDRSELGALLQRYFNGWEKVEAAFTPPAAPGKWQGANVVKVDKELTQANIILGHLGITRNDPDYYAVSVMNFILGGGGFSSRLMDNIRDNKGLSYDVHSSFSAEKYSGSFSVGLQTKNKSANMAIGEILAEMKRIMTEPVTDGELADAKSYLTGSFPLRIDSNSKIAGFLVAVEYFGLGLNYVEEYKSYIDAVTKEDILRVAGRYLNTKDYVLVVVGNLKEAGLLY